MNKLNIFFIPLLLAFQTPALADKMRDQLHKCKTDHGVVYQETACLSDGEIVGDVFKRKDEERKRNAEEKRQAEKNRANQRQEMFDTFTACLHDASCTMENMRNMMAFLKPNELILALGQPHKRQLIGEEEYWYYVLGGNRYQIILGRYHNVVNVY